MKKKLNKLICILLCILLISLSVVPVFAETYNFTSVSDFCTTVNPLVSLQNNKVMFVTSFIYDQYNTAYNLCIEHFEINTDDIIVAVASYYSTTQANCRIYTCSDINLYSYTNNIGSSSTSPYIYCQFLPGLTINVYDCAVNNSGTASYYNQSSTTTTTSLYALTARSTSLSYFYGFKPNKINYSINSSGENYYILDTTQSGGGGDDPGQVSFEYITMNKPPTAYTALSQAFYSVAATRLHTEFPTEYQNIPADKILVDDHNLAAIFEAITANTGVFESYAVHSYDFYDNVSYNLAEGMNAIQSAMSNMQDIADNIELLASVYASDQEIEAREAAADNQQAIVDNFLDSQGDGSVTVTNFTDLSSASDSFKDNFSTGASPSGIWSVFDNSRYNWFTQQTKNQLDTTPQTRGSNDYPTPLLDNYLNEIFEFLGINND